MQRAKFRGTQLRRAKCTLQPLQFRMLYYPENRPHTLKLTVYCVTHGVLEQMLEMTYSQALVPDKQITRN
jgi:hypothetical protein